MLALHWHTFYITVKLLDPDIPEPYRGIAVFAL
jgi:hypothetical protein